MANNGVISAMAVAVVAGLIVERCKAYVVDPAELGGTTVMVPVTTMAPVTNQFIDTDDSGNRQAARAAPEQPPALQPGPPPPEVPEPAPAPESIPAAPAFGSIAGGTTFRVTADEPVCTNTHGDGATFTAQLAQYLAGSNGVSVLAGARVSFAVHAGQGNSRGWSIEPRSIEVGGETRELRASASHYPMTRVSRRRDQVAGALVGAVIGAAGAKAAGRSDEEAAVVAIGGGFVGSRVASGTQACLNESGVIDVTLYDPLLLPVR